MNESVTGGMPPLPKPARVKLYSPTSECSVSSIAVSDILKTMYVLKYSFAVLTIIQYILPNIFDLLQSLIVHVMYVCFYVCMHVKASE